MTKKVIQTADNLNEMQSYLEEMSFLQEISQRISEKKPLDELLNEIMESCKILMKAEASSLMIYDEIENKLFFEVATGEKGEAVKLITCEMGEGIAGWVALNREPLLIDDCYKDPRFNPAFDKKTNFKTKNMICVPMIYKDKLIGVIQVINKINGKDFTERDLNLFKLLSSQCAISIENTRLVEAQVQQAALNRELKTARDIQQNILPVSLPKFKDIEVSATIIPAKQVGGDYYNIYKINDDQTLFMICDVSGKSISAALIVSTFYSAVVTYFQMNKNKFDLLDFVKCINRVLIESTTSEKFVTCWLGLYNHKVRILESINAGHNSTFVFDKDGNVTELNKGGMFLGCVDMDYESEKINLNSNNLILYYTDGVNEAMNKAVEQFGDERLINSVKEDLTSKTEIILKRILDNIKIFVKEAEQSDDITCGLIRIL